MFCFRNGPRDCSRKSQAELRVTKDISELSCSRLAANCDTRITFPLGSDNILLFHCLVCPREGLYKNGQFLFAFKIPQDYPFAPPKVKCVTKVLHPDINWRSGTVALDLLQMKGWKPVFSINSILYALQLLFLEPNLNVPLSNECQFLLSHSHMDYEQLVRTTLQGGFFFGALWDRNVFLASVKNTSVESQLHAGIQCASKRRRDSTDDGDENDDTQQPFKRLSLDSNSHTHSITSTSTNHANVNRPKLLARRHRSISDEEEMSHSHKRPKALINPFQFSSTCSATPTFSNSNSNNSSTHYTSPFDAFRSNPHAPPFNQQLDHSHQQQRSMFQQKNSPDQKFGSETTRSPPNHNSSAVPLTADFCSTPKQKFACTHNLFRVEPSFEASASSAFSSPRISVTAVASGWGSSGGPTDPACAPFSHANFGMGSNSSFSTSGAANPWTNAQFKF